MPVRFHGPTALRRITNKVVTNWHRFEDHSLRLFKGVSLPDSWLKSEKSETVRPKRLKQDTNCQKLVYSFGAGAAEGGRDDVPLLGLKGANLAEMCRLGLPVPPGFTIPTIAYHNEYAKGELSTRLKAQVKKALGILQQQTGRSFGDPENPLLLSVRPGARVPMPGLIETVLDLGLNDETVAAALAAQNQQPERCRYVLRSYRRFIQSYADIVLGIRPAIFERVLDDYRLSRGLPPNAQLSTDDLQQIVKHFKAVVEKHTDTPFPQDPYEQLWRAIAAGFAAWDDEHTAIARKVAGIPHEWGTAITIQQMVFGDCGEDCATGYFNTRDIETGRKCLSGRYLIDAQGIDLFHGLKAPACLRRGETVGGGERPSFEEWRPELYRQIGEIAKRLEQHFKDAQFVEFTVEKGKLFLLQTQPAQRSSKAAIRIAVELAQEGLISRQMAVLRVSPDSLDPLLHPTLDPDQDITVLTRGIPAAPGAASGAIVFDVGEAQRLAAQGRGAIFVCKETGPKDVQAMSAASGVLTSRGGMSSHAAVMARGMGKPCVTGAAGVEIDAVRKVLNIAGKRFKAGDEITIDGKTGAVLAGSARMHHPELSGSFATLMSWADEFRRMQVRANAEMPRELRQARRFGAEGLGLCRTEHMFFEPAGLIAIRRMILAETEQDRKSALDQLALLQQRELTNLFEIMAGRPVTIRLFDPPLHEFLPRLEDDVRNVADRMGISDVRLRRRIAELKESNPMLGHRGCRLAITYPEIPRMQARAIFEAAIEVEKRIKRRSEIEIMVPFVAMRSEFDLVRAVIDDVAAEVAKQHGIELSYRVGAMIEVPRAALRADDLSDSADFLSFGTNDLTQMVLGISRDDAAKFLSDYLSRGVWETDPFVVLDKAGVGTLLTEATERSRERKPGITLGICGEHGGDPQSIRFFEALDLAYISCSPFRVPVARLAAAQASLLRDRGDG